MSVNLRGLQDNSGFSYVAKPVKTAVVIAPDTIVANETASGMLVEFAAADAANYNKVYVSINGLDNTSGANGFLTELGNGERYVRCYTTGTVAVVNFAAITAADVEKEFYAANANTFSLVALGPKAGRIRKFFSATRAEVELY